MAQTDDRAGFERLLEFVRVERNFDFTGYKRSSLMRRTDKRMRELGIEGHGDYLDYLRANADEFTRLFNTILINVTSFFRDEETWTYLREAVLPKLLTANHAGQIRIWSAGCASGEEPFSVAILLAEALGVEGLGRRVKIYATDVDEEALADARRAEFSHRSVRSVPVELLERYFQPVGQRYTIMKELRRAVIFGRHNLATDAPISRIDLLLCRNTLMYFSAPLQTYVLDGFHFALKPNGVMVLGKSEMMLADPHRPVPLHRAQAASVPGRWRGRAIRWPEANGDAA